MGWNDTLHCAHFATREAPKPHLLRFQATNDITNGTKDDREHK